MSKGGGRRERLIPTKRQLEIEQIVKECNGDLDLAAPKLGIAKESVRTSLKGLESKRRRKLLRDAQRAK